MPERNDQPNRLSDAMAKFADPIEITGIWFNNKVVKLDGYKFIECRFDNCELTVSSPNINLERCHIDNSTTIRWIGNVINVIHLFNVRHDWIYQQMPDFAPKRNPDGTITIANQP